ncbi:pentatricopeptide repeat-containing protein At3g09040, mitochondrial-like [Selaginella moellendorffii]|uniref:pentatricopeptide repeat-containing protein At3g09040, mitochondrial-like n=1 Tax=Selaginella moellendorffii TaxID=88036 RepID=UPI000D1CFE6E|nr:pentatricopeptide repeat-containing protein At3g09040, mitochondrial-like [Selaginella moellendorffii]XP_024517304.1 pentatricopeptide repeat-containing protein At3g09040, mitochondrial-like [Selaginella moellendorffii]XP_024517305.1 pentatricopeptide repeat-containing protein At3g09040, mitochondrial-like [Selaginella moellendorffii]|eukprot:XP_024517303.1 pentatricopeptide repeat-containing protein At3g09040, mitochondrial-like [Selaginella moellendorffii]
MQMSEERLWRKFFEDPSLWWDNRRNKRSPSYPDFKHASTGECLWIHSRLCPSWVSTKLQRLDERPTFRSTSDTTKSRTATGEKERTEPLRIYNRFRELGIKPRVSVVLGALKACSSSRDLETGRKIHATVLENGDCHNIFVASSLVDMYAKCGSLVDARRVFDSMKQRNVVPWNCLILGYAESGEGKTALEIYSRMLDEQRTGGCSPNYVTFLAAVKACSSLAAAREGGKNQKVADCLDKGRAVHYRAVEGDGELHLFLANAIVDMYSKCGSMVEARQVFDGIKHRSIVSWNTIILGYAESGEGQIALDLFQQMLHEEGRGCGTNYVTYLAVLKACIAWAGKEQGVLVQGKLVKLECLNKARAFHSQASRGGHLSHEFVASALLDLYAKCGSMEDASKVFGSIPRSVVTWTSMIAGYAETGDSEQAFKLFQQMQDEGFTPDAVTFVATLKACIKLAEKEDLAGKTECLERGRKLHMQISQHWSDNDLPVFVANALVDMYSKGGSLAEALKSFERIRHKSVVSWTAIILGNAESGNPELALELYSRMENEGRVEADGVTIVAALKACALLAAREVDGKDLKVECLRKGRAIHSRAARDGHDRCSYVANSLIDMYANCGGMVDAHKVFSSMDEDARCVVSWNCLILGYVENGAPQLALELYSQMKQRGVQPVAITFVAALKACGGLGSLEAGIELEKEIREAGLQDQIVIVNSLVDLYGKCGSMVDAQRVFDEARGRRDLVTWNTLIDGYSRQGDCETVLTLFEGLQRERLTPDELTFLSVLTACSHAGSIDKGMEYFQAMASPKYGVVPGIKHYTCVIDLLSRANRLSDAVAMVKSMPLEPNAIIWMTLLGAAREWNNVEAGRLAFEAVMKLEKNGAACALMASIYAGAGMLEERWKMEEEMGALRRLKAP